MTKRTPVGIGGKAGRWVGWRFGWKVGGGSGTSEVGWCGSGFKRMHTDKTKTSSELWEPHSQAELKEQEGTTPFF